MKKILFAIFSFSFLFVNAQNEVRWMLSGALTPTSVSLRIKLTGNSSNVRALISTNNPPSAPFIYSSVGVADQATNNLMAKLDATGLQPGTKYYFTIEADGIEDNSSDDIGSFSTPAEGPTSFKFMAGSCNREPNTKTYNDFPGYNPLFYLNTGDLHYDDPCDADITYHRDAYEQRVFTRVNQVEMFRQIPFAYVWDDHDYCGNDASGSSFPGTGPARLAYQEYIPHYPLAEGSGNVPIYQSFVIGRVRYVLSDVRSAATTTSAMGDTQKEWFKNELIAARNSNQIVCWVTSYSWYGILADNWGGYQAERTELCEFFRDSMIQNMFIINGDAHMFAIDNGVNGDYTTAKNLPYQYPVLQAGPIENNGSFKGGTYSEGAFYQFFVKAAQYGLVEVTDNGGDSICITLTGYKKDLTTEATSQLVSYTFCRNLGDYIAGINDESKDESITEIFPNPSNGKFFFRSKANEDMTIRIFNIEGKFVAADVIKANTVTPVNLENLTRGVYFAKFENSNGAYTKRLIKE